MVVHDSRIYWLKIHVLTLAVVTLQMTSPLCALISSRYKLMTSVSLESRPLSAMVSAKIKLI